MKTLFSTLVLVLALSACSSDDSPISEENNLIITEPALIGKGDLYGNGEEQIAQQSMVISNAAQWEALQVQMNAVNTCTTGFTETEIDFSQWKILAVFDEIKPNGGHSIDIINVTENTEQITVTVDNLLMGDMTLVMTQPFHIVKIPASAKPVVFE